MSTTGTLRYLAAGTIATLAAITIGAAITTAAPTPPDPPSHSVNVTTSCLLDLGLWEATYTANSTHRPDLTWGLNVVQGPAVSTEQSIRITVDYPNTRADSLESQFNATWSDGTTGTAYASAVRPTECDPPPPPPATTTPPDTVPAPTTTIAPTDPSIVLPETS